MTSTRGSQWWRANATGGVFAMCWAMCWAIHAVLAAHQPAGWTALELHDTVKGAACRASVYTHAQQMMRMLPKCTSSSSLAADLRMPAMHTIYTMHTATPPHAPHLPRLHDPVLVQAAHLVNAVHQLLRSPSRQHHAQLLLQVLPRPHARGVAPHVGLQGLGFVDSAAGRRQEVMGR